MRNRFPSSNLAPVGVGAGVRHGEESLLSVPQLEVLVLEGAAVDGLAAGAVVVSEVAALRRKSIFIFYLREMELGRGFPIFEAVFLGGRCISVARNDVGDGITPKLFFLPFVS